MSMRSTHCVPIEALLRDTEPRAGADGDPASRCDAVVTHDEDSGTPSGVMLQIHLPVARGSGTSGRVRIVSMQRVIAISP